jgi:hypothetical protein
MKKSYAVLSAVALVGSITAAPSAFAVANATVAAGTAAVACAGSTATKYDQYGGPGTPNTVTANFVKVGFSVQCSANTHVQFYDESPTLFLVGAGSTKGNQSYKGSSNGGAVVAHGKCTATSGTSCDAGDSSTAASAASSM